MKKIHIFYICIDIEKALVSKKYLKSTLFVNCIMIIKLSRNM